MEKVLQAAALSLGCDPLAFCKLLHYLPQATDADALQRGIGAHRDFCIITLLLQGDVPGPEIWDEDTESYYDAPPGISLMCTESSANPAAREIKSRSNNGNRDLIIKCIETCRERLKDEKYAPISVEDYVRQEYNNVYGRVGIHKVAEKVPSEEQQQQQVGEVSRLDSTVGAAPSIRAN
ncbi:MAG: hypothetical protein Q9213_007158 [Squamulea squamosa]